MRTFPIVRILAVSFVVTLALSLAGCALNKADGTNTVPPPPQGVTDALSGLVKSIPNPAVSGLVGAGLLWLGQIIWPGSILVPTAAKTAATNPPKP